MTCNADEILEFWLTRVGPDRWFEPDAALDAEIRERFEGAWRCAAEGDCEEWITNPRTALALIILLDQFPRNMFRGSSKAYNTDAKARAAAKRAIARRFDRATPEPEREFFYLPLMHSEALPDQERCVRLIRIAMPETGAESLSHARRHREVIRRFGRFPARNGPLGRPDTAAERSYREQGGYMA